MKYLDEVRVIKDRNEYKKYNIFKGMIGTIMCAEIRAPGDFRFYVIFSREDGTDIADEWIKIEDLEYVGTYAENIDDEAILEALPLNNPAWWCKVEDGYILNLKGEKKNKIPYDYNS